MLDGLFIGSAMFDLHGISPQLLKCKWYSNPFTIPCKLSTILHGDLSMQIKHVMTLFVSSIAPHNTQHDVNEIH